jgi:hypothetical protein
MKSKAEVFSSGGGTQSCAIAALIIQGRLPKPDAAVIVDTGRERSTTWDYMDAHIYPALISVGVELHRVSKSDFAKEDVWDLQGKHLLIPAYTSQGDEPGKLSGFCSDKWKRRVRDRWLRSQGIRKARIWIGFSLDEMPRAVRLMRGKQWEQGMARLPLIYDVPMRREQSIRLVRDMGWPTPPRSNCWMCPNQSDAEWLDIKSNHPDEFRKAVELERDIQLRDPFAWMHKSCKPLDQVEFRVADLFNRPCESGACFI